jgi:hypothetical protein
MNIWIIKNIKFGNKYNTIKKSRDLLLDYIDNFLYKIISEKGTDNDKLIITGGMFSNINPSLITIHDAIKSIKKLSNIIEVILINTPADYKEIDNHKYSTLELFRDIDNVQVIYKDEYIISNNTIIDAIDLNLKFDGDEIKIPNAIQFDDDKQTAGILIFNNENKKHIFYRNNYSPSHKTFNINTFDDFDLVKNTRNDFVHLIISVKYNGVVSKQEVSTTYNEFDIIKIVKEHIGDNESVLTQFNKICTMATI